MSQKYELTAVESSEEDFGLRGDVTSDPCLKRMAVWRRDVGRQVKEKEPNGEDQRARRDRNKGVENAGFGETSASGTVGESAMHNSQLRSLECL